MEQVKSSVREEILKEAADCVCRDRDKQYGDPEDSFEMISELWNAYLEKKLVGTIYARDVAIMMALLKIARLANSSKRDSWVDLAGYAACGGEIDHVENERPTD